MCEEMHKLTGHTFEWYPVFDRDACILVGRSADGTRYAQIRMDAMKLASLTEDELRNYFLSVATFLDG